MSLFFLKNYLAVIIFSVAVFFLTVFVIFDSVLLKSDWKDFKQELVVDHQLLMLRLDQTPQDQWELAVADYQPVFGMVPELVEQESLDSVERLALAGEGPRRYLSDFSLDIWYGLFTLPDSERVLKISEDGSPLNDITADNVIWLILPILLISLSQAFGTILIIRSISKPVRELSETALLFGKGGFSARMDKPRPPVELLAQSFNTMAAQLEDKIREQQLMIGAIPHELRTPLSRIRFALDLSRGKQSFEALQRQIEQIDAYVDDLDCAVEDVLELTRLQSGKASVSDEIDVGKIANSVADSYMDAGIAIDVGCQGESAAYGNEGLIRRAMHNLMQNAVRFTETRITIRVLMENDDIVIQVEDDGVGIPADKLEDVFLVFSRIDKSRSRETGGIGLGLAFVQLIMRQHKGVAVARNIELGGLCVELRWPGVNRKES
ncbi:MAG: HAMP domain-containing protein [Candidatus Thiodiazotropha sp. (ex Epidulcina cf. delphinae)]|nr:HAMP domain-containing protein [Candidatus Thiodiazotropha sp. (ex Epidulcina cf. delphinae)]